MLDKILRKIEKFIPKKLYRFFQPIYHYSLALAGTTIYRFPGRKIFVLGVTGTKGKTSTIEIANAILEEAGYKTAIISTLRFKVGEKEERNLFKMTMPGRFFIQKTLRRAVRAKCDYALVEMTSEGSRFSRHKFTYLNALIFTNISPEHIESHGSFENYLNAKLEIAKALEASPKKNKVIVANKDDKYAEKFLNIKIETKKTFSVADAKPFALSNNGTDFTLDGRKIHSKLSGEFNLYNILAAVTFARTQNIDSQTIVRALEKFGGIRGRMEKIEEGQDFTVIVDYAHTADSMEKVYQVFQTQKKICVFGATGGGRDKWKRPEMGRVAMRYCDHIILTDDDSYDEDPKAIIGDIRKGMGETSRVEVMVDRREAIREAFKHAKTGDAVIITGKGTDPYLMGPNGTKIEWDDATVAREELGKTINK
ncbi:MAG: UDP-N-acetylmuramoyl-L-alanyl-D-glutamate--2,6-diaminopimelate ligase [Patescibacteria group bacterium]